MKNKLHYSPASLNDLDEIFEYIKTDLCSFSSAQRIIGEILDSADGLIEFAEMGAPLSSVADVETDYRFLVCQNYLIFYRVNDTDIYIDRILYSRRDYLRMLFDNN